MGAFFRDLRHFVHERGNPSLTGRVTNDRAAGIVERVETEAQFYEGLDLCPLGSIPTPRRFELTAQANRPAATYRTCCLVPPDARTSERSLTDEAGEWMQVRR
jgi:hypothetical protein